MLLRRSSERRAPLSYQGDGTYSNFPGSRLEHAPSKSDDDGATTLPYSPNFVRAHDGVASRSKRARPPPAAFELSHRPAFPLSNALTTAHTPDMANIKYIRPHGGPAPPPRDSVPKKRQPRTERSVTVESTAPTTSTEPLPRRPCAHVVTLEMADGKPAIFPTLNIDEAFREAPDGKHGIVRFLEERGHAQWDTLDASRLRVDRLYECKRFPDAMFSKERKWYQELKDRMTSPEGKAKLETFYDAFAFKVCIRVQLTQGVKRVPDASLTYMTMLPQVHLE
ncbi:hypothetical protein K491DRAFT_167040 [Lophiostoma macrostomum CBS 122681]|uniref:Uncharacterized protein n=1 Tax=Lophiostoma macrostomum CBS 122681 TaxID=1314788 RepID=A0A6A6THV2_9PLEO|nr:hypothetical protein K491DRAFT_167040 [Lophiostoma macrostomum CBS 122681]